MAEPTKADGPDAPAPERGIAGTLPPSAEDWAARIDELLGEADAASSTAERATVLCQVAEIYERRLGDPNAALVTLRAALEQAPTSGRVVQEMERVARSTGRWGELVAVTAEVASGLTDAKQAADLWVQIAFWDDSGLGMLEEAAQAAGTALTLAPDHGGALAVLENLYRRQRNWDRLVEILGQKRRRKDDPYKLTDRYREVLRYEPKHAAALEGLAGLEDETGAWAPAAETLRRLIGVLEVGPSLLSARHRLAHILKDRLGDDRAAEEQLALALATPGGGAHIPSLLALAAIYRDRKDWLKARQLLGRAAAAVEDPAERVRLLVESAQICAEKLGDDAQAGALYDEVIAVDPTRTDVVDALAGIRFRQGDWTGLLPLAEFLVAKAEPHPAKAEPRPATPVPAEATPALEETPGPEETPAPEATPAPEETPGPEETPAPEATPAPGETPGPEETPAPEETPGPEGAPAPTEDTSAPEEAPAPGETAGPDAAPVVYWEPAARARVWYLLGRARAETGDLIHARDAYRASLRAVPEGPGAFDARRDLATLDFRAEAWAEAAASYEALLAHHAGPLGRNETADAYERLGLAYLHSDQPGRALAPLERVLTIDPRRRRVLEALVEAAKAAGDDDAIVRHTQALLAVTEDRTAKRELLETVASIHRDRRNDPQRAIAAYRAVLDVWPEERSIMHRLLELLSATKQWKASVQMLIRLAELTEPQHRGPYFVAAGTILCDELSATAEAIDCFERALDADPKDLKTFERIDKLVTAARDWRTQARSYRRQIKRMGTEVSPDNRATLLALWHGLGEILRSRLKDIPAAIAAFEVATGLDPEGLDRRRILAELYRLAGPQIYPQAVAEERAIVERVATIAEMVPGLKIMLRLYIEMGSLDEAHAVAAVLVLAGHADDDERALYQQYRSRGVVRAHGRLGEDLWQRLLYHAEEDRALSSLLATLSPVIAMARAKPLRDLGLKRKQQRDVNTDPSMVCQALVYGGAVFGVQPPEIYAIPESPNGIELVNLRGTAAAVPALVIGRSLLEGGPDLELAFIVGRTLASVRPDHLLRWPSFVPTLLELEIALRAAMRVVDAARPVPPDVAVEVETYAGFLTRTLPPQLTEQLSALVRRFAAAHPGVDDTLRVDLARWSRAACLTTIRAGFLLSGDLEVSARLGQAIAAAVGIDPADVMRDLCTFGVSEAYFELRAALGLRTVNTGLR